MFQHDLNSNNIIFLDRKSDCTTDPLEDGINLSDFIQLNTYFHELLCV